jgi:hypothetical protein
MKRQNDLAKQMWITEFGWTSWDDLNNNPVEDWMNYVSPSEQGDYILRAFKIGQSFDFIGPMFLWNMNFADTLSVANRDERAGFSLLYRNEQDNYVTRPAYHVIQDR